MCATNFVFKILAILVKEALQRGCWFIQEHPNHEFSCVLRQMPMFPHRAFGLTEAIKTKKETHTAK
jgi:hypothetical protein